MKKIILIALTIGSFIACNKDDDTNTNPGGGTNNYSVTNQDRDFALKAAMGNTAEIRCAQLAATHSTDSTIMAFALMMINDHSLAQQDLQNIADTIAVNAPDSLDSAHVAVTALLNGMMGHSFDSAYI